MTSGELHPSPLAHVAAERVATLAQQRESGDRLGTKADLQRQVGVSAGTFNEALRLLQARGIVTVRTGPRGGIFVAAPSPIVRLGNMVLALDENATSVADAIRIRNALDPLLVQDAIQHASPADIDTLEKALGSMREAAVALDGTAFTRANWALHAQIATLSPNVLLRSFYDTLLQIIETHTVFALPVGKPLHEFIHQRCELHADLVGAIADRDSARAEKVIRAHATSSE